jgi:hypothetical protein
MPAITNLVITVTSPEATDNEIHSPPSIPSPERVQIESPNLTPTIVQQEKEETEQVKNSFFLFKYELKKFIF